MTIASRKQEAPPSESEGESIKDVRVGMEDVDMVDESEEEREKPKRKRKEKKVVPRGKNGLRKKRIVKTRTEVDDKGYMGTLKFNFYRDLI